MTVLKFLINQPFIGCATIEKKLSYCSEKNHFKIHNRYTRLRKFYLNIRPISFHVSVEVSTICEVFQILKKALSHHVLSNIVGNKAKERIS